MIADINFALLNLAPGAKWSCIGGVYSGLEWLDESIPKPTEQEVNNEIERLKVQVKLDSCKDQAKKLIANCDWSVLPDVNISNRAEFETYRATLRGYILNPVADPVFPTEPNPVWV